MLELKVLLGSIYGTKLVHKILSESATIRRTVRKCHNQKNFKKVPQSKTLPRSITLKRECCNHGYWEAVPLKVHPESATIKSTRRECRNQKYCQGVSQLKYLRKCHHQKYYQGPPQSKVLSGTSRGTATIKTNDRECRNKIYPGSAANRSTTRKYDH